MKQVTKIKRRQIDLKCALSRSFYISDENEGKKKLKFVCELNQFKKHVLRYMGFERLN